MPVVFVAGFVVGVGLYFLLEGEHDAVGTR